jgi:polysaccharide export outer membrane protein
MVSSYAPDSFYPHFCVLHTTKTGRRATVPVSERVFVGKSGSDVPNGDRMCYLSAVMMRIPLLRLGLFVVLMVGVAAGVFSQTDQSAGPTERDDPRMVIARGLSEYPVTVGDQYRVFLQRGGGTTQIEFSIPGTYIVNLGPVGVFSAEDMTLEMLRDRVEAAVESAYPSSFPRLELVSIGLFRVWITGAIPNARLVQAWGLSRLSELVGTADTSEASLRRVEIISDGGASATYDLFRARRGETAEDPLVRPGDRIVFPSRIDEVSIGGQVLFPGTYEVLDGDTLDDVIFRYAGGLTPTADPTRVKITSVEGNGNVTEESVGFISREYDIEELPAENVALRDQDRIAVPSRAEFLPAIFFEGAVCGSVLAEERVAGGGANQSDQYRYQFHPGETVADAVRAIRERFLTTADLSAAFIERDGDRIPIDIAST